MQFTTIAIAALSIGSAIAAVMKAADATSMVTVHVVSVGSANGTLTYSPNNLKAAKGDMVQFQFWPANHTVTQSTFDAPCEPISSHSKNVTGVFSGFMPVKKTDTEIPTYTIMINATTPMWLYCSQAKHCQKGMVMVINENTAANASRSLQNFETLASSAAKNLAPSSSSLEGTSGTVSSSGSASSGSSSSGYPSGGSSSGSSSSGSSSSGDAGSSSSGSASTPTNSSSTPNSASNSTQAIATGAAAGVMSPSAALSMGLLLAFGAALFL